MISINCESSVCLGLRVSRLQMGLLTWTAARLSLPGNIPRALRGYRLPGNLLHGVSGLQRCE